MDDPDRTARNMLFQELKPSCINLSQLALKNDSSASGSRELRIATAKLYDILDRRCRGNPAFDGKLADYVFFPLSHVLRVCQHHPTLLAELATKCTQILLEYGWTTIDIDLGYQLVLLLTLFAGGGPLMKTSEELQVESYKALSASFQLFNRTPKGSTSLVDVSKIPAISQCLTVVLDGIDSSSSPECQLNALFALKALWACIKDQQALSTFLPGTVSALTKALIPSVKAPRSRRVIITAINVLQTALTTTLGDIHTRNLKDDAVGTDANKKDLNLSKSWLKATGGQIKLALANVVKLCTHKHVDVRAALEAMCLVILDECQNSLIDSASLLVETAMSLDSNAHESTEFSSRTSLVDLATIYPAVAELIKATTYKWVTSLPRIMQSNNEDTKQVALYQLTKAHNILSGLDMNSGVLDNAVGASLRDSVLSLVENSNPSNSVKDIFIDDALDSTLIFTSQQALVKDYRPIVMSHDSQTKTRESFRTLISSIGVETQVNMASDMLDFLKTASDNSQLSALWLSFQLLKAAYKQTSEFDDFISSTLTSSDEREIIAGELYSFSVSILVDLEDDLDWRIQAVALEIVAFTAKNSGEAFRPDLIDSLYPVVQLLGSNNSHVREHAIVTLNKMSTYCAYQDTSGMIVGNVDYLVNSIALKLNTFDISPQAPQVLVMMIRLSESALLPYLDDIVSSIFAALDNFHGYPRLVDGLFSVLGEIIDESSRSGRLQIAAGPDILHHKKKYCGSTVGDIVSLLETRRNRLEVRELPSHVDFPRQSWNDATSMLEKFERSGMNEQEEKGSKGDSKELLKAAPTRVYKMVQSITRLGQHYLTSQSPVLRRRLLELINTACQSLYWNEDEFLPLINDIWPVLVKRLYDEETFVATAAASTIGEVFRRAGDFMSTRLQVEWPDLMRLAKNARNKAAAEKKGRHGRGVYSQTWQMWEALIQLLITTVEYVRLDDRMFDEVLDLLGDLTETREDIRNALSIVNADAVWLIQIRNTAQTNLKQPELEGYNFCSIDAI